MLHPQTEVKYIDDEAGYGVIAKQFMPKGTITWVQDPLDRIFTPKQYSHFDDVYRNVLDTYTFRNNKGNFVLCWDNARFVNHSFKSNCLSTAYDFEIAIRDIEEGEELTDDYGYLNISEKFKGKNEGTKRKYVYPNDLKKYYMSWDRNLLEAIKLVVSVEQTLQSIIPEKTWKTVEKVANSQLEMKSILSLYYENLSTNKTT